MLQNVGLTEAVAGMLLKPRAATGLNVAAILMNLSFGLAAGECENSAVLAAAPNLAWASLACVHEPGQERTSAGLGALLNMCLASPSEVCRTAEHFVACLCECLQPCHSTEVQHRACDVVFALCRRTRGAQKQACSAQEEELDPVRERREGLRKGGVLARLTGVFGAAAGAPLQRSALFAMLELAVDDFGQCRAEAPLEECIHAVLAGKESTGAAGPLAETQVRYLEQVQKVLLRLGDAATAAQAGPASRLGGFLPSSFSLHCVGVFGGGGGRVPGEVGRQMRGG